MMLFILFLLSYLKKKRFLINIFNRYEIINKNIFCNNFTLNFECTNITYLNYRFNLSYIYTRIYNSYYNIYNSKFISNFSINKIAKRKINTQKGLVNFRNKYTLNHFNNIYVYENGVLQFKCIIFNLKGGCGCKIHSNKTGKVIHYRNVFSITQTWGNAVFHSIIECLTKIGILVKEIIEEQSIYIHLYNSAAVNYLLFLGIKRSRIIHGNIFASSLIITSKTNCGGYSNIQSLNNLRIFLRKISKINQSIDIVLIKRKGKRSICNFNDLYTKLLRHYNLRIYNNNDSMLKISNIFSSSKVIIAPHGAGLSNIVFCHTETTIIEFLDIKRINLCYNGLAKSLGLIYIGIIAKLESSNCFYVNISFIQSLITTYYK